MPEQNDQSIEEMFNVKVDNNIPDGEIHLVNKLGELKGKMINVGYFGGEKAIEQTLSHQRLMNEIVTLNLCWQQFLLPMYDTSIYTMENLKGFAATPWEIKKRLKQLPEYLEKQARTFITHPLLVLVEQLDKIERGDSIFDE